jgi:thioredoxin 2
MNQPALVVACPACASLNRVASNRLPEQPNCGRCHQALFQGKPVVLTESSFQSHAARSELPLLVDFWAPWCGPCLSMAPQFEAAARSLEPQLRLGKVDTEAEQSLGARFQIRSIPTLVLIRQGREIARQSGAMASAQIVQWAQAQMSRI